MRARLSQVLDVLDGILDSQMYMAGSVSSDDLSREMKVVLKFELGRDDRRLVLHAVHASSHN